MLDKSYLLVVKDYVRPPDALVGYADDVDATCEKDEGAKVNKTQFSNGTQIWFWWPGEKTKKKQKKQDRNRKSSRSGDCRSIFESANSLSSGFDYVRPADGTISPQTRPPRET